MELRRVVQERSGTYRKRLCLLVFMGGLFKNVAGRIKTCCFFYVFIGGLCRNVAERIENTIICSFLLEGCAGT